VEQIIVERHAAAGRRTIAGPRLDVASILDVFSLNLAAPHGPPFFPVARFAMESGVCLCMPGHMRVSCFD
jgi:hypothetical protein